MNGEATDSDLTKELQVIQRRTELIQRRLGAVAIGRLRGSVRGCPTHHTSRWRYDV